MTTYSDWIGWSGGEQPVADNAMVEVRIGEIKPENAEGLASEWYWNHDRAKALDVHITAYRVVQS